MNRHAKSRNGPCLGWRCGKYGRRTAGSPSRRNLSRALRATCLLAAVWAHPLAAQTQGPAFLVKDINTLLASGWSSEPRDLLEVGRVVYFSADDQMHGRELWRSDGTPAGTWLVKDINPGAASSSPQALTAFNDLLIFVADDGSHGNELWASDGTADGTLLLRDVRAGVDDSLPYFFTAANGELFFAADDGVHGRELWKTDGTVAGTMLVADIYPGIAGALAVTSSGAADPPFMATLDDELYFVADDGLHGAELWRTDGTALGTSMVRDISPGPSGSLPRGLAVVNGMLVFSACQARECALWRSDGTANGTTLLERIVTNSATFLLNGVLFLTTSQSVDSFGSELWRTDGTPAGTQLVKDINPGPQGSFPTFLGSVDGRLLFFASDGAHGYELWQSDGSEVRTTLVKDIADGSGCGGPAAVSGRWLFYRYKDAEHGCELWRTDGTATGTVLVKDIFPGTVDGVSEIVSSANGGVFLSANDGTHGAELWYSDGTVSGTALVEDIALTTWGSNPRELTELNGLLYFVADAGANGTQLWRSDGTAGGTTPVEGVPLAAGALTAVGGRMFFVTLDPNNVQVWRTDGTVAGTIALKTFHSDNVVVNFTDLDGVAYFGADDGVHGNELWRSDGTVEGTYLFKDISPGRTGSFPGDRLIDADGLLYFTASENFGPRRLWQSDGTNAGTRPISFPASINLPPAQLTAVNGTLFFAYNDGEHGGELWKVDHDADHAMLVADIAPGAASSNPWELTNVNGTLFFLANDGAHGLELWKSDGTSSGTILVKDILPGADSTFNENDALDATNRFTPVGNTLFFTPNQEELWRSDGTDAGTMQIGTFYSFSYVSSHQGLGTVDGALLFNAQESLWRSDGTAMGTIELQHGVGESSSDQSFVVAGSYVFFGADGDISGTELWAIPLSVLSVCDGDCDGSWDVTIGDLLTMVNVALGNAPLSNCGAGDVNGDGTITVDEILTGVHNAFSSCDARRPRS